MLAEECARLTRLFEPIQMRAVEAGTMREFFLVPALLCPQLRNSLIRPWAIPLDPTKRVNGLSEYPPQ